MSWYDDHCLPWVVERACSAEILNRLRGEVVPLARGRVLEVGLGAGHNLPWYDPGRVEIVYGVEPSEAMRGKAARRIEEARVPVELLPCSAEEIPLPDRSIDSVVVTFTLCTIADWRAALREMRRLLVPGGKVFFCEHGLAPHRRISRWQNGITPYWKRISGGCHLNRPIAGMLVQGGFTLESLEEGYVEGAPKVAGYVYRGVAVNP